MKIISDPFLLLDTHAWLWLIQKNPRINSRLILEKIHRAAELEILALSVISVWEIGMLAAKGKIELEYFSSGDLDRLLKLLGYVLSPLKITLLVLVIIKGFMEAPEATLASTNLSEISHFWNGLTEGYNTMDLLAAFFFAPIVISSLGTQEKNKNLNRFVLIASVIGASLLALIYIGFCYLAYFYAPQLTGIPNDKILGTIALKILGPYAGLVVSLTVTFACLTTAIALIAAFASFIQKEILREKIGYVPILISSLLMTFAVTTLEFQGIARLLNPVLEICYPVLILLTFYNLFKPSLNDGPQTIQPRRN